MSAISTKRSLRVSLPLRCSFRVSPVGPARKKKWNYCKRYNNPVKTLENQLWHLMISRITLLYCGARGDRGCVAATYLDGALDVLNKLERFHYYVISSFKGHTTLGYLWCHLKLRPTRTSLGLIINLQRCQPNNAGFSNKTASMEIG